ncbi:hypothetical protein BHM03_00036232 [Ensete ventricosum]|nr:hypothetical protein BHM03_00036232 [Ensete ventricosum]
MPDIPMPGVVGGMLSPYDMGGLPMRDAPMSQPIPIGALASALANATPEQQRMMLGENLYPLVEQLEHDHAAKVTGMLLEMDQTEVLHLLESPDALKAKVGEAMEVLRNVAQQHQANAPTDQLAALPVCARPPASQSLRHRVELVRMSGDSGVDSGVLMLEWRSPGEEEVVLLGSAAGSCKEVGSGRFPT